MASNPFHVASDKHGVSGDTGSVISRVGISADAATSWEIFCLITGEDRPFSIEIPSNATVSKLKKAIKAEISKFATVEAYSLTLYLVNAPDDKYLVNLRSGTQPALRATNELSVVFTGAPAGGTVHILVQPPDIGEGPRGLKRKASSETDSDDVSRPLRKRRPHHSGPDDVVSDSEWCPRQDTVSGLLELLRDRRVVQVRGTPASGKTTLMYLLHARIVKERPNAKVFIHKNWPRELLKTIKDNDRLKEYLPGYPSFDDEERYFLFDEGQTIYWDTSLWLAFKDNIQSLKNPVYAILFCSYGNESLYDPLKPTPPALNGAKVTLNRIHRAGSTPFGLLLDKPEFCDVIERSSKLRLTDDLRDFIYRFTRGHVGATVAVSLFLLKKARASMLAGIPYSLKDFDQANASYEEFCRNLCHDIGMPECPAEYAQAMRALLLHGSIDPRDKSIDADIQSHLEYGYKLGFVNKDEADLYTFASPLHQQLWSWHLPPQIDYQLPFQDLLSFVKDTVSCFRLTQLDASDHRVGSANHPEAQYQEEYYRCVHKLTEGNVRISPEYAAAAVSRPGRIHFFIPLKKWGIELTRDGSRLDEHNSRFADEGAYGQWLGSSNMDDYVLLDFCSTKPIKAHPGIRSLYHVVLSDDKTQLDIYDNQLNIQDR